MSATRPSPLARLEIAYRRLLVAYPGWYRREHGLEVLTTLMDAAGPRQRRPHVRDAIDLVRNGLRRRLTPPRGPGYAAVACVCAAFAALGGAGMGGAIAWSVAPTVPPREAVIALAENAVGRAPDDVQTWRAPYNHDVNAVLQGVPPAPADNAPETTTATYVLTPGEVEPTLARVVERLGAAGWTFEQGGMTFPVTTYRATREGMTITVMAGPTVAGGPSAGTRQYLGVVGHLATPVWTTPAAGAGLVAGGAIGWLLGVAATHRARRLSPRSRIAVAVVGGPSLLFSTLAVGYFLIGQVILASDGLSPHDALFPGKALADMLPVVGLSVVGLCASAALLNFAPRARASADGPRPGGPEQVWGYAAWLVAATQFVCLAGWLTITSVYLGRLYAVGGDRSGMLGGAYDPKDLVPFGNSPFNPFGWLLVAVTLVYTLGFIVSPLLLAVSVPALTLGRRYLARRTKVVLVIAAVSAVALPLLMFTPLSHDAGTWLFD